MPTTTTSTTGGSSCGCTRIAGNGKPKSRKKPNCLFRTTFGARNLFCTLLTEFFKFILTLLAGKLINRHITHLRNNSFKPDRIWNPGCLLPNFNLYFHLVKKSFDVDYYLMIVKKSPVFNPAALASSVSR